jgi:hypothetical protein
MKFLAFILLLNLITPTAFSAEKVYWSFTSNSASRKTTQCSKLKDTDLQPMIKNMGCIRVFSSGILFCSEKRVIYLFPDEAQCLAHYQKIKF